MSISHQRLVTNEMLLTYVGHSPNTNSVENDFQASGKDKRATCVSGPTVTGEAGATTDNSSHAGRYSVLLGRVENLAACLSITKTVVTFANDTRGRCRQRRIQYYRNRGNKFYSTYNYIIHPILMKYPRHIFP